MADALSVNIGSTSDDPRKLNKTVTWITKPGGDPANINCYITDTCDILYPKLIVKYSATYLSNNYAKISSWGNRYYYINSIDVIPGGKMLLSLSIDVLMTYATVIKNCPGMITRCTWSGKTMIPDDQYPLNTNKRTITDCVFKQNPRVFNATQGSIIIQTVGGDRTAINNNNE